jgi:hypothetical protein
MTKKFRKRVLRILLTLVSSVLVLVIIASIVLYTQQQRLTNMALTELNKRFAGELVIDGSEISPFENFPYVSIGLRNVRFYPTKAQTGRPMYQLERLFVGFSLPDVLKEHFNVKVILLKNGHLDLTREPNGTIDLVEANMPKSDSTAATDTTTSSKQMDLDLKKIILRNIDVDYKDKMTGQEIASHIDKIKASFQDNEQFIKASLDAAVELDVKLPTDTVMLRHKHIALDIAANYDKQKQEVAISPSKLKLEEAVFKLQGTANLLSKMVDFKIDGDKPDFKLFAAFAPKSLSDELKHFKYDGDIFFNGIVKGSIAAGQQPFIEVHFGCEHGWMTNTDANKKVDSLAFKGYYTNGSEHSLKTSELHMLNVNAHPEKGIFKGNFVMRDFTNPKIIMQVNSELELEFIGAFLGIKDMQRITGHISLNMDFKELVDISTPEAPMNKLKEGIQSELTVSNLTFRVPNYPFIVRNLDMHAKMVGGQITLDSMAFKFGNSDFYMNGSLSDLPALFHAQEKPVSVTLNAHSNRMVMKELLAFDTAKARKAQEEINNFNIGLSLQTSVNELLHPKPLPRGQFHLEKLYASFKKYPHAFHDFGADLTINDTALLLKNFGGKIDSSDLLLSGRVVNYKLWFEKVMRGKTSIAFDFKSNHLAADDLLGRISRTMVPSDYQHEVASGVWLRAKSDLRYDSVFQFAKVHLANVSGSLKVHAMDLQKVNGTIMYSTNKLIRIDTLTGKIGHSDFNVSMRYYTGDDTLKKKKTNFINFASQTLDLDELTNYKFTEDATATAAPAPAGKPAVAGRNDSAKHEAAFNIFTVPFTEFTVTANIGRMKYHKLYIKNFTTNIRMQTDHKILLDTLGMGIAEGTVGMRGRFDGTDPKNIFFKSRIRIVDMNMEKMLLKLDYFGQDYVINKNIQGRLNGTIRSMVKIHPDLTPIVDASEASLDLDIRNGVLINFAPMQAMSSFFKDKNLSMVRFDTLRNKLAFKNGVLDIPNMNINSSLGYMEISGKQGIDLNMEYYMRIPLKMVTQVGFQSLFGKKREEVNPDQVDAIEYRDVDKKVRFMNIKVTGTPDKFKIALGKAKKA